MTNNPLPIDPKVYRSVLQQIQLREVNLRKLHVECEDAVAGDVHIDISSDASHLHNHEVLQIDTTYKIEARGKKTSLFTIEVAFRLYLSAPEELPESFVDVY